MSDTLTKPEKRFYAWEKVPSYTYAKAQNILVHGYACNTGECQKAYQLALETLRKAWEKHGFERVTSKKLKTLLIAAAQTVGWYGPPPREKVPQVQQPDDPTLRTCISCKQTKPKELFTRRASEAKARCYGWREDTEIKVLHRTCNVCANPKKKKLRTPRTNPSASKLRVQMRGKLQRAKKAWNSDFMLRKIELIEIARLRLTNEYVLASKPAPQSWEQLLTKEERDELRKLHSYVAYQTCPFEVF